MIISVSELIGNEGASLRVSVSEKIEDTAGYPDVVVFLEPVKIEGILTNVDDTLVLDAKGSTAAELLCSRCLSTVAVKVDFTLNEKFSRTGIVNEETETFSSDCLDISDVVKRSIISELPMKVLCREDCGGLCPVCGKRVDEGGCNCDTTVFNPQFEGLRALFKVDEEV